MKVVIQTLKSQLEFQIHFKQLPATFCSQSRLKILKNYLPAYFPVSIKQDKEAQQTIIKKSIMKYQRLGFNTALTSVKKDNRREKPKPNTAETFPKKTLNPSGIFKDEKKIDKN